LACARRNCRHEGADRFGAGSTPARCRMVQTVLAPSLYPEPTQSSVDAAVAPGRVLPGQPQHQRTHLWRGTWTATPVWVGPTAPDQVAMPTQQRGRLHQQPTPAAPASPAAGRSSDRPVVAPSVDHLGQRLPRRTRSSEPTADFLAPTGCNAAPAAAGALPDYPLERRETISAGSSRRASSADAVAPLGWVGSWPVLPQRRRQHLLDRPAPATPAEQDLDPDARPLRPPDEGERLAVPGELVVAVVPPRGQRPVAAGQPGTRQVHGRVRPSPIRILTQRQVGLSFQRAPELLVRVGPLVGWGVRPRAWLVGHLEPPPPRRQVGVGRPTGGRREGVPAQGEVGVGLGPPWPPSRRRSQPTGR
jgi:hypothetical protein